MLPMGSNRLRYFVRSLQKSNTLLYLREVSLEWIVIYYDPAMIMARALSVTPLRPSVLDVRKYVRRPLSILNTFDQNFMKLGHIV